MNVGIVVLHHIADRALQRVDGGGKCRRRFRHTRCRGQLRRQGFHFRDDGLGGAAAVASKLAPDQIVRLDAGGAFVNRRDARIAHELGGTGFLDESDPAMHLDAERGYLHRIFRAPALENRNHQIGKGLMPLPRLRVRMQAGAVQRDGDDDGERTHRFCLRLHEQQHAPHVGMPHDGHPGAAAHPGLGALDSLARILQGRLIRTLGQPHSFDAHRIAGGVHHDEHVFQSAILLADELRHGAAVLPEGQHTGGAGVDSKLVLHGQTVNVVARSQ